jgi:hypothetical protein
MRRFLSARYELKQRYPAQHGLRKHNVSAEIARVPAALFCSILLGAVGPSYTYRETKLELAIPPAHTGSVELSIRRLDQFGRAVGKWKKVSVQPNQGRAEVDVDVSGGHEIEIASPAGKHRVWATRGTWYALPRSNTVILRQQPTAEGSALGSSRDITLAGAFSVKVDAVQERAYLEIGRTLGMDLGASIRPPLDTALVLVGGGSAQGVVVTLTEKRPRDHVRYWDYALNLEQKARRHVIPLSAFTLRDGGPGQMRRIEAIAIRTVRHTEPGDQLFIDALALLEAPLRIGSVRRSPKSIAVELRGTMVPDAKLIATGDGVKLTARADKKKVLLSNPEALQSSSIMLCYPQETIEVCDPPDAPLTRHLIPHAAPQKLLVDDFPGTIPVNALRMRTAVYTSTIGADPARVSIRRPGSIEIFLDDPKLSYAGYRSPLPPAIPPHLTQLSLTIASDASPERIKIGLRDLAGREPKVSLAGKLTRTGVQTIQIPLAEFGRKRRKLDAITVTLEAGEKKQRIEISRIELLP